MSKTPPTTEDEGAKEELLLLLKALKKEKFADDLLDKKLSSIDAIADTNLEDLPLPRMVARQIKKAVDESEEVRFCCDSTQKQKFYPVLIEANLRTTDQFLAAEKTGQLPQAIPKMVSRLLSRKITQLDKARELRAFLKDIHKEQFFWILADQNINAPQDLSRSSVDALATVLPSKMVARLIYNKACELCQADLPDHSPKLSQEDVRLIQCVWTAILASQKSFGFYFYKNMLTLDSNLFKVFDGVSFHYLGKDFDRLMSDMVKSLTEDPSLAQFTKLRDDLLQRFFRYRIPSHSLRFSAPEAFETAAIRIDPDLELQEEHNSLLNAWRKLFVAIIPPLHPALLKSPLSQEITQTSAIQHLEQGGKTELVEKLATWFARHRHSYLASYLKEHSSTFANDLFLAMETFRSWQRGQNKWSNVQNCFRDMLGGIKQKELGSILLFEIPRAVEEMDDVRVRDMLEEILMAAGFTVYSASMMIETFRSLQRDLVWRQWDEIYRFTHEECGERIYQTVTASDGGRVMFSRTNMKLQRQRFVHQLNSVLVRINEDIDTVLRPLLLDLGHRHRVMHHIESSAIHSFDGPLLQTVSEMLGRTAWRRRTKDAWGYVTESIIFRIMKVGWAGGNDPKRGRRRSLLFLRQLREKDSPKFDLFLQNFGSSLTSVDTVKRKVDASRYESYIKSILDEPDVQDALDRIRTMSTRHKKFHGVTSEDIQSAETKWISSAESIYKGNFSLDTKLHFARFWDLLWDAFTEDSVLSLEEKLMPKERAPIQIQTEEEQPPLLTLQERIPVEDGMALLHFKSNKPVPQRSGQFAKLRVSIGSRTLTRFYSILSAPDPATCTSTDFEFLVKEVKEGKVSPFLIHEIDSSTKVQVLKTAGSFTLPKIIEGHQRIMISAGVGVVAFVSTIRTVAAMVEKKMITKQVHLSLIHSERKDRLRYVDDLIEIAKAHDVHHKLFRLDLTLCITGKSYDSEQIKSLISKGINIHCGRVNQSILSSALGQFSEPAKTPMYACGPRIFQKTVRETFLNDLGHSRRLVNLEFFDL